MPELTRKTIIISVILGLVTITIYVSSQIFLGNLFSAPEAVNQPGVARMSVEIIWEFEGLEVDVWNLSDDYCYMVYIRFFNTSGAKIGEAGRVFSQSGRYYQKTLFFDIPDNENLSYARLALYEDIDCRDYCCWGIGFIEGEWSRLQDIDLNLTRL